jgi:glycosyltransferase involved in cell wall biosynthesis
MNTAIVHDQLKVHGGAEHVAFHMAREFDCPIYAGYVDESVVPDDIEVVEVFEGTVGQRCMESHYLVQDAYQMVEWQRATELRDFDRLIINKTNPLWYVPQEQQTVLTYLHSTPRGLYDQFARHEQTIPGILIKTAMRTLVDVNRLEPDYWVCNSELIQQRLRKYWRVPERDSTVVHPPVETKEYNPDDMPTGEFYLSVSRLRDHKRVRDIITAFNQLGTEYPLVIAGTGPQRDEYEQLADAHIEFTGYVDEREKQRLYSEAKAFIMAAENEDFGMTPVESMAAGTPVLGVREGYTQHQIIEGKTGYTWPRASGRLAHAVKMFDESGVAWDEDEIADFASEQWAAKNFTQGIRDAIKRAERRTAIDPWEPTEREVVVDGGDSDGS